MAGVHKIDIESRSLSGLPSAQALSYGLKPAPLICYGCYFILAVIIGGLLFFPFQTCEILAGFVGLFGAGIGLMRLAASFTPPRVSAYRA